MNGSEPKYSTEYVQIQTALEHIRTKIEDMEAVIRDIHRFTNQLSKDLQQNRSDIAGVKAVAAIIGGVAGSLIVVLSKFLLSTAP